MLAAGVLLMAAPSAGAAFGSPIAVTADQSAGAHTPAVAADSATTSIVAWIRLSDRHVFARRVAADGSTGPVMDLSDAAHSSESRSLSATADGSGNVTVVWTRQSDGHVVAVRIPAGGVPGGVVDVSQGMVAASPVNAAAADGLGNVHVVWRKGSDSHVLTAAVSPAGVVGAVQDVSGGDADAALWGTAPGIAADALGNTYFTWHRNTDCHIMLRRGLAGGGFDAAADVSQTVDKAVGDTSPAVAVAGSNALVVWHRDGNQLIHDDDTVYYSLAPSGGAAGAPTQLSPVGDVSMEAIAVAGAPDGSFTVGWQQRVNKHVFTATVAADGSASGQLDHSSNGDVSATDGAPATAASSNASAYVAFRRDSDGAVVLNSSAGNWTAPPPAAPAAGLKISRSSIRHKRGKVLVTVSCDSADGAACGGSLSITARGKRPAVYGKVKFSLADGSSKKLTIKLSRKARAQLRRKGKLKVAASAKATVDGKPQSALANGTLKR